MGQLQFTLFLFIQINDPKKTQLILSVHHEEPTKYEDASAIWAEKSESENNYTACTVETRQLSGNHTKMNAVSTINLK